MPVAATLSVTSPVVAGEVRYCVALAVPVSWRPPTEVATAAPPATTSRTMTNSFSFMGVTDLGWDRTWVDGEAGCPSGARGRTPVGRVLRPPGPRSRGR